MPSPLHAALRPLLMAAALIVASAPDAGATLQVDRIEVELLAANGYRGDVAVTNDSGDETAYVEVLVFEVLRAGTAEEQRVEHRSPEEAGFLAAPRQLVLSPGQTKLVRLVSVDPPATEDRIFRVQIRPVVGDLTGQGMVVKVVLGYDMLVIVRPDGGAPEIVGERQGRRLVLRNRGNSTGYLLDGKSCDAGGSTCTELPGKRMYPGNELAVELPHDGPVTYRLGIGLKVSELSF